MRIPTVDRHTTSHTSNGFIAKLKKALPYTSLMERVLLLIFGIILTGTTLYMLWSINERFLVTVPAHGGELTEGIIGTPRFINPVLALTDADKDITALIYSGLMRISGEELVPDLAQTYDISTDGKTYTFYLRDDIFFHDGTPVTSDDVVYTISMIKDALVKSPRASAWNDVTVSAPDARTVIFTLENPYAPFLENATIGILPRHLWYELSPEQFSLSRNNINPVGSGPYRIEATREDKSGIPEEYVLTAFSKYSLGKPYIDTIITKFYINDEALLNALARGEIDSTHGITPTLITEDIQKDFRIESVTLPRVFGIFFNQNKNPVFAHLEVREALSVAIDREVLIERILHGFGEPLYGPTPDDIIPPTALTTDTIEAAQNILSENGWEKNESGIFTQDGEVLRVTITTTNIPELKEAATAIQDIWRLVGIETEVDIFDQTALNQTVIRPREYEALLFGEVVGRSRDLYPFWHSSGRNDPGLNIAIYTNNRVDKMLEDIRMTTDLLEWNTLYDDVRAEIIADMPAVFLYAPDMIYIIPEKINNFSLGRVGSASERFSSIHTWYMETQRVWKIFAHNNQSHN